jgi:hypothetical protein
MKISIVLNCASRTEEARYGFLSWLLQDHGRPFEIVLNLFGKNQAEFELLQRQAVPNCAVRIHRERGCQFFNISAANNLGAVRASGELLVFANADIVYPNFFLRELVAEIDRANLHYAICNRVNLSREATARLLPVSAYHQTNNLNFLSGLENAPASFQFYSSPWVVRRDAFWAVGGFDNNVVCHEDYDLTVRLVHYLRRTRLQSTHHILSSFHGYHLDHPASDMFNASDYARKFFVARSERLNADPASDEDIVKNDLSEAELLRLTCDVLPPVSRIKSGLRQFELVRRIVKAGRILLRG